MAPSWHHATSHQSVDILTSQTLARGKARSLKLRRVTALASSALIVAGAGLATAGSAGASLFQPPGTPLQCPALTLQSDGWTRISPALPLTQPLLTYAVPSDRPQTIYETDGQQITRSTDSGCTSRSVYVPSLPADLPNPANQALVGSSTIADLETAPSGGDRVMALMQTNVAGSLNGVTTVATSPDGSQDWRTSVPLTGEPEQLAMANQTTAYVLAKGPLGGIVYATNDGGSSWLPKGATAPGSHLAVDPNHIQQLFTWGSAGLYQSGDGGTSFSKVAGVSGAVLDFRAYQIDDTITIYEASHPGGGLSFGIYNAAPGATVHWQQLTSAEIGQLDRNPGVGLGSLFGYAIGDYVSNGKLYLSQRSTIGSLLATPIKPSGSSALLNPQAIAGGWLVVQDASGLWRVHLKLTPNSDGTQSVGIIKPGVRAPLAGAQVDDTSVKRASAARILPATQTTTLIPGQTAKLPLELDLPAEPTPLDVMFVIDTTSSMEPTIGGLRDGINQIVKNLTASGIDVHFGVADFQDYPVPPWGCPAAGQSNSSACSPNPDHPEADHPYKRLLPISAPGPALAQAINGLLTDEGNGNDQSEAALAGVFQAATGAGQLKQPSNPGAGYWVEPNQGADWRPHALHVIVMTTDQRFHRPQTLSDGTPCLPTQESGAGCNDEIGYPGPTFAETIAGLNAHQVRLLGLDVSGQGFDGPAFHDESILAAGTSTFAPAGGVDCDAAGNLHLRAGAPLACPVTVNADDTALPLATPILALLHSLRDYAPVSMQLSEAGKDSTVATLSRRAFPSIDVKAESLLKLFADVRCPLGPDSTHNLDVNAAIRGQQIAHSSIELDCVGPKAAVVVPVLPAVVAAFNPPPPPPPPPPANPNPNPNPQLNPQLGAASQQEEEGQLATAENQETSEDQSDPGAELAMSARRDTDAWAYELGVITMLSAAALGLGIRSRRKVYLASSEVRDSRTTVTRI